MIGPTGKIYSGRDPEAAMKRDAATALAKQVANALGIPVSRARQVVSQVTTLGAPEIHSSKSSTTTQQQPSSAIAAPILHSYSVVNASVGATPKIRVTTGNHLDSGASIIWIPTIDGVQLDVIPAPVLTVSEGDLYVLFNVTAPAGIITAISVESTDTLPAVGVYQLVASITVTITGGVALVVSNEGGVAGSQSYQACVTPDGTTNLFGLQ